MCTIAQTVRYQEDGSHQESEKEREDCQVDVPVMKAFSGKFEYSNSRKILKYLARLLETNVKRKILSDTSHQEDFSSFEDCRALLFAVAEIRLYADPYGQVAEYWSQVLTKLQSNGRFPEKKNEFLKKPLKELIDFKENPPIEQDLVSSEDERGASSLGPFNKLKKNKFGLNEHSVSYIQFSKFNRKQIRKRGKEL